MNRIPVAADVRDHVFGTLLTDPGIRAVLRATPATVGALRVQVFTIQGREIINMRASETEITVIEIPATRSLMLQKKPGSIWFYGKNGETVGFRSDAVTALLANPLAVESAPNGPTTPRTLATLQDSLRAAMDGLANLTDFLEARARSLGADGLAYQARDAFRFLRNAARPIETDPGSERVYFVGVLCETLGRLLYMGQESLAATDESREAAFRFEPVHALARAVHEYEIDRAKSIPDPPT